MTEYFVSDNITVVMQTNILCIFWINFKFKFI